jgi:predicted N-acetyltransferase YhbS
MLRRAEPEATDWRAVLDLILESFAVMEGRIDPPSSAHRLTVAEIARQAADGVVLLAEREGDLVGCVFLTRKADAMYLGKLAVKQTLQRQGHGRRLVEAAKDAARREGYAAVELQVRVELAENHAAFAAMGFREVGRTAHAGYDRPTSLTMRCAL